jgi:hypothetical protein
MRTVCVTATLLAVLADYTLAERRLEFADFAFLTLALLRFSTAEAKLFHVFLITGTNVRGAENSTEPTNVCDFLWGMCVITEQAGLPDCRLERLQLLVILGKAKPSQEHLVGTFCITSGKVVAQRVRLVEEGSSSDSPDLRSHEENRQRSSEVKA